jgi:hypothetical protein
VSANISYNYQRPSDLLDSNRAAALDLAWMDVDGVRKLCVKANALGQVCAVDIEQFGILEQLLNGLASGIFGGATGTRVATKYTSGTTLTVVDDEGFEDLDPIAVLNEVGGAPMFGQVDGAPAANAITLQHDLSGTVYKNAYVLNLREMFGGGCPSGGVGFNWLEGVVSQSEAPDAPSFEVDDGTGDTIDVDITDPEQDAAQYFDIFVRQQTARPTRLEPNWQPDVADRTIAQIASAINVTTHGGGADYVPDGTGGNLATTDVVWVGVIAKDATGQIGVKRSPCTWISHTLD